VLVVDDEHDSRELLCTLLERCGAHVVACDSAASGLSMLEERPIQLIVADIAMPELDGYELIRRARRIRNGIAAVAVSAYARPEDRSKALEAGYDAYCPKPLDASDFIQMVHGVMKAKAADPRSGPASQSVS